MIDGKLNTSQLKLGLKFVSLKEFPLIVNTPNQVVRVRIPVVCRESNVLPHVQCPRLRPGTKIPTLEYMGNQSPIRVDQKNVILSKVGSRPTCVVWRLYGLLGRPTYAERSNGDFSPRYRTFGLLAKSSVLRGTVLK